MGNNHLISFIHFQQFLCFPIPQFQDCLKCLKMCMWSEVEIRVMVESRKAKSPETYFLQYT